MIRSLQTEEERTLLEKLTWLLTTIVNGKLPLSAEEVISSTQGLTIPKKDRKARPLGLRETLVNLALKILLQMTKDKLTATFNGVNYALSGRKIIIIMLLLNHELEGYFIPYSYTTTMTI